MKVNQLHIRKVNIRKLRMKLKSPFTTSLGTLTEREFLLVEVQEEDGGISGWGESVAFKFPSYTEETVQTTEYVLKEFLLPIVFKEPIGHPDELLTKFAVVKRHHMAKAAVEGAVWDLYAKKQQLPLAKALGGKRKSIHAGISIGLQRSIDDLLACVHKYSRAGYQRFKIKIQPGQDVDVLREVRRHFPDLKLMADANAAYTLDDVHRLKRLDDLDLMMIEQPLPDDHLVDHARLQRHIQTPICLDESIHSLEDVRTAVELGSCQIVNIKPGRVGGLSAARKIHDYCLSKNIPVWCGGMLESGVGRAQNIALAALQGFTLPGDIASSSRYWEQDIVEPEVNVDNGTISVPTKPGIGYTVNRDVIEMYTESMESFCQ